MPLTGKLENNNLVVIEVTGQLGKAEVDKMQTVIAPIMKKVGQIKILIFLKDFTGWEAGKDWDDTSFSDENDAYLHKMAIVGDEKWRDLVTLFTLKGLRPVPIEYFGPAEEEKARQWLDSE